MTPNGTPPTPPPLEAFIGAFDQAAESVKRDLAARLVPYMTEDQGRLLDAEEKARQLGVNPETLVKWARAGRVPSAEKVGREWRFPPGPCEILPLGAPLTSDRPAPPRRRPEPRPSVVAIRGE
jgi:hypothetical protein